MFVCRKKWVLDVIELNPGRNHLYPIASMEISQKTCVKIATANFLKQKRAKNPKPKTARRAKRPVMMLTESPEIAILR